MLFQDWQDVLYHIWSDDRVLNFMQHYSCAIFELLRWTYYYKHFPFHIRNLFMTFIAFHRPNNVSSVISISIHWSVEHSNCVVYKSIMDIMLFPAFLGTSAKMWHFPNMTGRNVINPNGYLSIPTRCLCVVNESSHFVP